MLSAALKLGRTPDATNDDVILSAMDRAIPRRLLTPRRLVIVVGALLIVAIAIYAYIQFGRLRTLSVGAERITISKVSYETFREYIPVTGNVVPRTSVYLDAVDGGQITAVYVEAGELVIKGQPLVVLKNTKLQLEVIGREAQLTEQLNNLSATSLSFEQNRLRHQRELIEINYQIDRLSRHLAQRRPLLLTGAAAQSELTDLEADLKYQRALRSAVLDAQRVDEGAQSAQIETLREAIVAMNKNLTITRENLDNLMITAPISGQITLLEGHVGESRAAGQRIGQIDDLEAFKVSAFIDEFYLSRVTIGQVASVEINGATRELEIVKVYPDVRNRQFEVELTFLGHAPELMRRGQTVRMRLEIGQPSDTLVLKNGAFFGDTGGAWVFVLDESENIAERQNVRLGRRNPEGIEILDGLHDGDRVITSSYGRFMDVDVVRLDAVVD